MPIGKLVLLINYKNILTHSYLNIIIWFKINTVIQLKNTNSCDPYLFGCTRTRDKIYTSTCIRLFCTETKGDQNCRHIELAFLPKTKENVSWLRRNNINSLSTFDFLFLSIELNFTGPVRKAFRNRTLHVSDTRTFLCIYGLQLARGPPAESDV